VLIKGQQHSIILLPSHNHPTSQQQHSAYNTSFTNYNIPTSIRFEHHHKTHPPTNQTNNMQFFAILAALTLAVTVQAGGDPCCNYTNGGKCIQNCPGKRSLGLTSLATRWVNRPRNALPAGVEHAEESVEESVDAEIIEVKTE
jgi:hypothetical protein